MVCPAAVGQGGDGLVVMLSLLAFALVVGSRCGVGVWRGEGGFGVFKPCATLGALGVMSRSGV